MHCVLCLTSVSQPGIRSYIQFLLQIFLCESNSLRCLNIANNQMEGVIGPEISALQCLESIDLSGNLFTSISSQCFLIPTLKECNISDNPNLKDPPVYLQDRGFTALHPCIYHMSRCLPAQTNTA